MPEIGEVARIVHYIRQHLIGKTLAVVKAQHDENVFGKVGTSAAEFEKALKGKKILDAKQQGKYFWMVMSSPPHPLMHFGMAGWFKFRDIETAYYRPDKPSDSSEWPPKYWKFTFTTAEEPQVEAAFVDFRRFARIRLVDCEADNIRNVSPLVENGPDPVVDKDVLTETWLTEKLQSKRIPVKALLLDQANISGIGNWVGDEILYDAHIHPEQYSNTLSPPQITQLHTSLHHICSTAVSLLAESARFPETWLFKHRWGKGKKDSPNQLPNGEKIVFLTVGGRTSAVVPSVQKKTGPVSRDVDGGEEDIDKKPKRGRKRAANEEDEEKPKPKKRGAKVAADADDVASAAVTPPPEPEPKPKASSSRKKRNGVKTETPAPTADDDAPEEEPKPTATKQNQNQKTSAAKPNGDAKPMPKKKIAAGKAAAAEDVGGQRRSKRVSGRG